MYSKQSMAGRFIFISQPEKKLVSCFTRESSSFRQHYPNIVRKNNVPVGVCKSTFIYLSIVYQKKVCLVGQKMCTVQVMKLSSMCFEKLNYQLNQLQFVVEKSFHYYTCENFFAIYFSSGCKTLNFKRQKQLSRVSILIRVKTFWLLIFQVDRRL